MIERFLLASRCIFFKSEGQRREYFRLFPALENMPNTILSCNFMDEDIDFMLSLRGRESSGRWIVLGSNSKVKGQNEAVKYCIKKGWKYEILWGMDYRFALERLAESEGLVYLPMGFDTCPRLTVEAKLMGKKVVMNDYCQHRDEGWYQKDSEGMAEYLKSRPLIFWEMVRNYANEQAEVRV